MSSPSPNTPVTPNRPSFDQEILERARSLGREMVGSIPEVRGVLVVIDYHPPLSTAPGLDRAVWVGEQFGSFTVAETFGMLRSLNETHEQMVRNASGIADQVADRTQRELQALASQRAAARTEANADVPTAPTASERVPAAQGQPSRPAPQGPGLREDRHGG